jgi:hypothetical protein
MFTATITSKNFAEGVMQVLVEFSNGTQTVPKAFNISSERNLKSEIRNELVRLNELEVLATALPLGVYDPTEAVVPLTQEQIDKGIWFRNFNKLEQLTKLNTLGGLRPALVTDLDTLKATVSTDFKKAYIADM